MNKKSIILFLACIVCTAAKVHAEINREPSQYWNSHKWNAVWITQNSGSIYDYGIKHFRKAFNLTEKSEEFIILISADQRYELFVNGKRVCHGPAQGDPEHWYFETIDIAPYLQQGENLLAATVWHYGQWSPGAQMSVFSGLIIQGNSEKEEIINTNSSWKVLQDISYSPSLTYLADVGPGDIIDGKTYPWGWQNLPYPESESWVPAKEAVRGQPALGGTGYQHPLVPRDIPLMEKKQVRFQSVRRSSGIEITPQFPQGNQSLEIPANTQVSFLLDQGYLTNAYPELKVSRGTGASVSLTYAEGLYKNGEKGNRNIIDGKEIHGFTDVFYTEGGENRMYRPLWFRTYRYVQVDIQTSEEPLIVHDLTGEFTGYPFIEKGAFSSDDPSLKTIWDTGWRTARLCAVETYFDCPYYERLQYTGDTRIQALISLYVSGDDRLMRKALHLLGSSRNGEGILRSRYPAGIDQFIPPFSLYWINMLHDYWMHRDDPAFVSDQLPVLKSILEWYSGKIDPQTGMLGKMPHWNFVDWPKQWPWNNEYPLGGVPPGALTGGSAILSLQYSYALTDAIELLSAFGETSEANKYINLKKALNSAVLQRCYDRERRLMADDIARSSYSQHASIMGILSDAIPQKEQQKVFERLSSDTTLIQGTVYYHFYYTRAMEKVGLGNWYPDQLSIWKNMLSNGLTTFAEQPEPSRSDCHAWSASPLYYFLSLVCGIKPDTCGFKTVQITPHLGRLNTIEGRVPHPQGEIEVKLKKEKDKLIGTITLPKGISGIYKYNQKKMRLNEGINFLK